jgi:hypothetical protein
MASSDEDILDDEAVDAMSLKTTLSTSSTLLGRNLFPASHALAKTGAAAVCQICSQGGINMHM